jgi:hypothetical protein
MPRRFTCFNEEDKWDFKTYMRVWKDKKLEFFLEFEYLFLTQQKKDFEKI